MTEKHLLFFDFILPKLSEQYDQGKSLRDLAHKYKKETGTEFTHIELQHFQDLYDFDYFQIHGNLDYAVITPEKKTIIDNYGSLSNYFKEVEKIEIERQKENEKLRRLTAENLKLQNENLNYQQTIRKQEERIRNLDEHNKFIQVIRGYWWLFGVFILIGILIAKILNI